MSTDPNDRTLSLVSRILGKDVFLTDDQPDAITPSIWAATQVFRIVAPLITERTLTSAGGKSLFGRAAQLLEEFQSGYNDRAFVGQVGHIKFTARILMDQETGELSVVMTTPECKRVLLLARAWTVYDQ